MAPPSRRSVKINKLICSQCKIEIDEQKEENIACDKCNKIFHSQCTKLDKRQFIFLLENESEEYTCHFCEGGDNVTIKEELSLIKNKLNQLDQLSHIHESMTFLSKQYDDILKGMVENNKILDEVKKENSQLKQEINYLKNNVKTLNDERVKNQCIVIGLKPDDKDSAAEAVLNFSKKIGVEMNSDSIDDAFYLNNRNKKSTKKNVIVKFDTKKSKEKFMAVKPILKEDGGENKVFVNDLLSKETLSLLNYAKTLKTVGYLSVYPNHGRIFAKKSAITRPRLIKDEDDVDAILLEASTNKQRMRRSMNKSVAVDLGSSDDEGQVDFMSPVTK